MESSSPSLSIVIVTWNAEDFVAHCLSSVPREDKGVPHEILVIDNASTDGTCRAVERFEGVRLVRNDSNAGFARANNQGIREAKGEYVLLLNPDTLIPDPGIFRDWIAFMDRERDVGASGCRLVYPDGSHQVGDAGFRPSLFTAFNFAFFLSKLGHPYFKGLFFNGAMEKETDVDWVCGAAFLVRKSILERTGLLDERIFMYAEDVEWGCRIRSFGYRVCYLPGLKIIHLQGASLKKLEDERISSAWLENLRRLYKAINKRRTTILFDLILTCAYLLRFVLYSLLSLRSDRGGGMKKKARMMFRYVKYLLTHMFCPLPLYPPVSKN